MAPALFYSLKRFCSVFLAPSYTAQTQIHKLAAWPSSALVSCPCTPCVSPSEKLSGERCWISWAYSQIRTIEIARSVIITHHFPYYSNIFISTRVSVSFFWMCFPQNMFLDYTVTSSLCKPKKFVTRPFFLVSGWGLGMRQPLPSQSKPNGPALTAIYRSWLALLIISSLYGFNTTN